MPFGSRKAAHDRAMARANAIRADYPTPPEQVETTPGDAIDWEKREREEGLIPCDHADVTSCGAGMSEVCVYCGEDVFAIRVEESLAPPEQVETTDAAGLCRRLRRSSAASSSIFSQALVNPDGPEAAAMLETLTAKLSASEAEVVRLQKGFSKLVYDSAEIAALARQEPEGSSYE